MEDSTTNPIEQENHKEPGSKNDFLEKFKFMRAPETDNDKDHHQKPGPEQIGHIAGRIENPAVNAATMETKADTKAELKKEAKSAKEEIQEIEDSKQAFEAELDKKIEIDKKTKKANVQESQQIDQEIEEIPLNKNNLEKVVKVDQEERPEVVMERVEVAAANDLPIESLYERRHESKDKDDTGQDRVTDASQPPMPKTAAEVKRKLLEKAKQSKVQLGKLTDKSQKLAKDQPPLYKQAVTSGFWTAIALLAGIIILVLLS